MGEPVKTSGVPKASALPGRTTLDLATYVRREYAQGTPVSEIAGRVGQSEYMVRKLLRQQGVQLKRDARAPVLTGQAAIDFGLHARREYEMGKSVSEIAAAAGRSESNVRKLMRENGAHLNRHTLPTEATMNLVAKAKRAFANGKSVKEIAADAGLSEPYVRQLMARYGVNFNSKYSHKSTAPTLTGQAAVEFAAHVKREFTGGKTIKEIAMTEGRSEYYVRRLMREHGVEVNRRILASEATIKFGLEVKCQYESGVPVRDIAVATGRTGASVRTALQRVGVRLRYKAPTLRGDTALEFAEWAKREHDAGKSIMKIAEETGRSEENVRDLMRLVGVQFQQPRRNPETVALVKREYENGAQIADIARQIGLSPSTVWKYLKSAGVEIRPRTVRS